MCLHAVARRRKASRIEAAAQLDRRLVDRRVGVALDARVAVQADAVPRVSAGDVRLVVEADRCVQGRGSEEEKPSAGGWTGRRLVGWVIADRQGGGGEKPEDGGVVGAHGGPALRFVRVLLAWSEGRQA